MYNSVYCEIQYFLQMIQEALFTKIKVVLIFYATFETFFMFIHQGPFTLIKSDS